MKRRKIFERVRFALAAGVLAIGTGVAATDPAAADWAALQAVLAEKAPADLHQLPVEERILRLDRWGVRVTATAWAFYDNHPADPRRWAAALAIVSRSAHFYTSVKIDPAKKSGTLETVADEAQAAAWKTKVAAVRAALLAAKDLPRELEEKREPYVISNLYRLARANKLPEGASDLAPVRDELLAFFAKFPATPNALPSLGEYFENAKRLRPAEALEPDWAAFAQSPHPVVAERAQGVLRVYALGRVPLELKFTAADGRDVDLAKLRGKVVLIDFWATWCHPCIEELPNVKKVYAAYHDRGFEVIGIALENAKLAPKDSPTQAAAKLAAAKKVLLDFTAKAELPWPHYFDGKWWGNDLAVRYGIGSVPATLLLDPEGKVVSTEARGEKLEQEVKRLLKL